MLILRRLTFGLIVFLVLIWCVGWFIGQRVLLRELNANLTNLDFGDISYAVDRYAVGGFPLAYRINPKNARIIRASDKNQLLNLDDNLIIQISLPGILWNGLTGGPIGPRIFLSGRHEVDSNLVIEVAAASLSPTISHISFSNGLSDLIFAGIDFNFQNFSIRSNDKTLLTFDQMSLTTEHVETAPGYIYDFSLTGLEAGGDLFTYVPNRLETLSLHGRIQPDVRTAYVHLVQDLQNNFFSALGTHMQTIVTLMSSEPGFYLDKGSLVWGEASLQARLSMPFNIERCALQMAIDLNGDISGTNFASLLRTLLKEDVIQSTGLGLPISGFLIGAHRVGFDLEGGSPSVFSGTLLTVGKNGVKLLPNGLLINGQVFLGL